MKSVVLVRNDYDRVVYPAVATAAHGDTLAQLRMANRVLDILEHAGTLLRHATLKGSVESELGMLAVQPCQVGAFPPRDLVGDCHRLAFLNG